METIDPHKLSVLEDPYYRGLRLTTAKLLDQVNRPQAVDGWVNADYQFAENKVRDNVRYFITLLTEEEKEKLNLAYVAFLRIRGLITGNEAVSYNLIGQAVRWKLNTEFRNYELKPRSNDQ